MHLLSFDVVEHKIQKFTHRLVFGGARAALLSHGLDVDSTQTSAGGRRLKTAKPGTGPELAVAVRLDSPWPATGPIKLSVELSLSSTTDDRFNRTFVLRDLRDLLGGKAVIGSTEKTEGGSEGDLGIRIRVVEV